MIIGTYKWKKLEGVITPGGDPCWICPNCGGDDHVCGIETLDNQHNECKECKTKLDYPWTNYDPNMSTSVSTLPKTQTFHVNHITEEEMKARFQNIYTWISDRFGVIEVTVLCDDSSDLDKKMNLVRGYDYG